MSEMTLVSAKDAALNLCQSLTALVSRVAGPFRSEHELIAATISGLVRFCAEFESQGLHCVRLLEPILGSIAHTRNFARGPIKIGSGTRPFSSACAGLLEVCKELMQKCEILQLNELCHAVQEVLPGQFPVEIGNVLEASLAQPIDLGTPFSNPKIVELFDPAAARLKWRHGAFLFGVKEIAEWMERIGIDFQILRTELELELAAYDSSGWSERGAAANALGVQAAEVQSDAYVRLLRVFTNGVSDDRFEKARQILADVRRSSNDKLAKIDALIPFPATASAPKLAEMLGVSKTAVLNTDWWRQNRKGEKENMVGRRRECHRERANRYEAPSRNDDD